MQIKPVTFILKLPQRLIDRSKSYAIINQITYNCVITKPNNTH